MAKTTEKQKQKTGLKAWISAHKWLTGAIVVIILAIGAWRIIASRASSAPQFQTSTVQKGTIVSTVSASGKALTTSSLTVNTGISGVVKKVYVKDGDKVYTGERIADITPDSAGAQQYQQALTSYLAAKNAVTSANINYYNVQAAAFAASTKLSTDPALKGLSTTDPLYVQENDAWLAAEANFNNLQNVLAQAQSSQSNAAINLQLASPTITAPYSGTIADINLVEGMVIASTAGASNSSSNNATISTQRIAVIENNSTPIVNVSLSEIDVPSVKIGQKATVTFDSITGKTFTGTVATVDRIGTVSSNVTSYGVNIKLDSGSDQILPNMAATANIILQTKTDVLTVPSAALITQGGSTYAKTLQNGKEVDVPVETGISSDTDTEITSGLTEGQTVITGTTTAATTSSSSRSLFSGGFGGGGGNVRVITGGRGG